MVTIGRPRFATAQFAALPSPIHHSALIATRNGADSVMCEMKSTLVTVRSGCGFFHVVTYNRRDFPVVPTWSGGLTQAGTGFSNSPDSRRSNHRVLTSFP